MGREVVVAVMNGNLDFGPWEQIFYGEFDPGPLRLSRTQGAGLSGRASPETCPGQDNRRIRWKNDVLDVRAT